MIYDVFVPEYIYETKKNSVGLELYRLELLNNNIKDIVLKHQVNNIKNYLLEKFIKKAFAKFIFNIFTNRTYGKDDKIYLDDGLFNIPTDDEINDFYKYLNDGFKNKNIKVFFKSDQFNWKHRIKVIIDKLHKFNNHHNNFDYHIGDNNITYNVTTKQYEKVSVSKAFFETDFSSEVRTFNYSK